MKRYIPASRKAPEVDSGQGIYMAILIPTKNRNLDMAERIIGDHAAMGRAGDYETFEAFQTSRV